MPGTFLPKSVKKWLARAEIHAEHRREKNEFETARRAKRQAGIEDVGLEGFDFAGLWEDSEYALEHYVGAPPSEAEFAQIQAELGYRLPAAYKALVWQHNGGMLAKTCFENPLQRSWLPNTFSAEGIYGIDREKPYSLCGSMGSRFWIEEWGYPDIGVAVCDTMSGGHDMIFLDYSDCGPQGVPCVVHIDQESDYEITYLADSFEDFVRGLSVAEEED